MEYSADGRCVLYVAADLCAVETLIVDSLGRASWLVVAWGDGQVISRMWASMAGCRRSALHALYKV